MWFESIVDTAIVATITMDVADEKPPRKASSASSWRSSDNGSVSTKRSGLAPCGRTFSPTTAIGMMNSVMPNR